LLACYYIITSIIGKVIHRIVIVLYLIQLLKIDDKCIWFYELFMGHSGSTPNKLEWWNQPIQDDVVNNLSYNLFKNDEK